MSKLYTLWGIIRKLKYVVVLFFIVLINGVLDDNSWMENYKRKQQIEQVKNEIAELRAQYEEDTRRYEALDKASELERVAREKYFMKRADEDVFVVVGDELLEEMPADTLNVTDAVRGNNLILWKMPFSALEPF